MKPLNIAFIVPLSLFLMSSSCDGDSQCPPQNTETMEVNNVLREANRHYSEVPVDKHQLTQVMSISLDELQKAINTCREAGKSNLLFLPAAFTAPIADMYVQSHPDVVQADVVDHTFVLLAVERDGGGYDVLNTLTSICPPPRSCGVINDTTQSARPQIQDVNRPPGAPDPNDFNR